MYGSLAPTAGITLWHIGFLFLAMQSLIEDQGLRDTPCGKSTHVFKFASLNTIFAFFGITTYCFFPGGGEGARARAMVMTIFHFAFLAWGLLMWVHLTPACEEIMTVTFTAIKLFCAVCNVHNGIFGTLLFAHEMFSHQYLGYDMTLVAEVTVTAGPAYPSPTNTYPISSPPAKKGLPHSTQHDTGSDPGFAPSSEQKDSVLSQYLKVPVSLKSPPINDTINDELPS